MELPLAFCCAVAAKRAAPLGRRRELSRLTSSRYCMYELKLTQKQRKGQLLNSPRNASPTIRPSISICRVGCRVLSLPSPRTPVGSYSDGASFATRLRTSKPSDRKVRRNCASDGGGAILRYVRAHELAGCSPSKGLKDSAGFCIRDN
jgi:hypothetical protein